MNEFKEKGIVTKTEWYNAIQSEEYDRLAQFSHYFLTQCNTPIMKKYLQKWGDPIKHCSRKFEYPYFLQNIEKLKVAKGNKSLTLLDIGSGLTFLPFYLKSLSYDVKSIDIDPIVNSGYAEIKSCLNLPIPEFHLTSVADLTIFKNDCFDIAYSVSVLEHIPLELMEKIFKELNRVIKYNGSLIISFDISLDGLRQINIKDLEKFISIVRKYFTGIDYSELVDQINNSENNATTDWFKIHHPSILPWPDPTFREKYGLNRKFHRLKSPFFSSLAFYKCILKPIK